jgi:hypothetical protein
LLSFSFSLSLSFALTLRAICRPYIFAAHNTHTVSFSLLSLDHSASRGEDRCRPYARASAALLVREITAARNNSGDNVNCLPSREHFAALAARVHMSREKERKREKRRPDDAPTTSTLRFALDRSERNLHNWRESFSVPFLNNRKMLPISVLISRTVSHAPKKEASGKRAPHKSTRVNRALEHDNRRRSGYVFSLFLSFFNDRTQDQTARN